MNGNGADHQRQMAARWIAFGDRPIVGEIGAMRWRYDGVMLQLWAPDRTCIEVRVQ